MACFTCGTSTISPVFATLSRAAAKYAASRLRGAGVLRTSSDWVGRTAVCERCPLYTLHHGKAHCGRPLLRGVVREQGEGCGCPIVAKAQSPGEHCPLGKDGSVAVRAGGTCDCKWCVAR